MSEADMEVERDYETEAKEQGFNANYDGPNKVDAKTFVERGEKIAGILKTRLDKQESQIESLQESNRQFGEYHKQTLDAQRKKDAGTIADLKAKVAQAVTDGDGQAYTKYSNDIDSIQANQQAPTDDAQAWNQLSQRWASENKWYADNPKLSAYADGISDRLRGEGYTGQSYFSELTRRVQEDFPDEFTNPNRSMASSVEAGGDRGTTSEAGNYDSLPADAKAACDDFVKQGFMTQEDYVRNFEFDEGGQ